MDVHRGAVERSLALHRAVVEHARGERSVVEHARQRVRAWERDGTVAAKYVRAWSQVLGLDFEEMAARVLEDSERGHDLRQVSPFAGTLDARERWRILDEVRRASAR